MNSKEVIAFDADELLEMEMILVDEDAQAALEFLKQAVWKKIQLARKGRLKCHLDYGATDTVADLEKRRDHERADGSQDR